MLHSERQVKVVLDITRTFKNLAGLQCEGQVDGVQSAAVRALLLAEVNITSSSLSALLVCC